MSSYDAKESHAAKAFNDGCDARLAGKDRRYNRHPKGSTEWISWELGWIDVDKFWGRDASPGTFWPLPLIVGNYDRRL